MLQGAAIWNKTNTFGYWRDGTNWSSSPSAPTLATGGTYVTNRTSKTVVVDVATPQTNLVIGSLNVWAAPGFTNTLVLQDLGATPLVVSNNSLDVRMRGAVHLTNSSLVVTGNFIQFNLWAGTLVLDSGSLLACEPGQWTNSTIPFRVGRTNAAEFVMNGGSATVGAVAVGQAGLLNSRSHGTIRMAGGEMRVLGEYSVGNAVNCTGVVHMTGGLIHIPPGNTNTSRIGDDGVGVMTISNAVLELNNLSVSRHTNSQGTLVLHTNGIARARDDVSVGRFPGSNGRLFLAGGELWCTNQTLWIGREGRGSLVLSNGSIRADSLHVGGVATNGAFGSALVAGGSALLSSNLVIGTLPATTGEVMVAGGQITVTNRDYAAYLEVPVGTVTLAGGALAVDNLTLTNPAGRLQFLGGTLQASFSQVANGSPFVVGDGVQPATLVLGAGTHVFADGLVISPNATVTGCATILGQVINNGGTLSTSNCVPLPVPPRFLQVPASLTVTQGAAATFTAAVAGSPAPALRWHFTPNGGVETLLSGATNATLALASVQPGDAGTYRVEASNPSGTVSASATLQLLLPPSLGTVTFSTTSASVAVATQSGLTYVLEYKSQLGDPAWTTLLTTNGTGGLLLLTDPAPGLPARFYRVRVQ
ncbi:MAG: hypothetical protein RJA22_2827 [Verrucomicrobiota bacterium]